MATSDNKPPDQLIETVSKKVENKVKVAVIKVSSATSSVTYDLTKVDSRANWGNKYEFFLACLGNMVGKFHQS